jgi:hypothetical protein
MPLEEFIPHVQTRIENAGLWDGRFGNEQKKWFIESDIMYDITEQWLALTIND